MNRRPHARTTAKPSTGDTDHIEPSELATAVMDIAAQDGWEAAAAVLEAHWDRLATTAPQHLLAAIRALPGDAFVDRPTFLVAANYLQHVMTGGDTSRFNDNGWLDATMTGSDLGLMDTLGLLTGRSAGARTSGKLAQARQAAERARSAFERASEAERSSIRASLPHFRLQWGRAFEMADASGAESEYEEAYELAILTDQMTVGRRAASHRAWMNAERGYLRAAELWLARALDQPAANGRYDAILFLTTALLRLDRGDHAGATRELARVRGLGDGEHWAAALWVQSMHAHDRASGAIADAQLAHEMSRHPETVSSSGANGRYVRAARARLAVLRSQVSRTPNVNPAASSTDKVIAAALANGGGSRHRALEIVRPAIAPEEPTRIRSTALLITAAAALNLDLIESAKQAFIQAHALIEDERLYSAYESIPSDDLRKLADLTSRELPDVSSPFRRAAEHSSALTRREHEVLTMLALPKSMLELSAELYISPNTLKATIRRLYRKLDVNSRAAAVDTARQAGLI